MRETMPCNRQPASLSARDTFPPGVRVILYGNSVFLAGIKAELESRGQFDVTTIAACGSAGDALICAHGADVVIFDLVAAQPNFAVTLLRDSPGPLLIGVDPSSDQLLVLSGHQARAETTTDLVQLLAGRSSDLVSDAADQSIVHGGTS